MWEIISSAFIAMGPVPVVITRFVSIAINAEEIIVPFLIHIIIGTSPFDYYVSKREIIISSAFIAIGPNLEDYKVWDHCYKYRRNVVTTSFGTIAINAEEIITRSFTHIYNNQKGWAELLCE